MTIYEVIENLNNKKQIMEFLADLLWGTSIAKYDLYRPFLNSECEYEYKEDLLEWLKKELWAYFDRELVGITQNYLLDGLNNDELVSLLTNSNNLKEVIKERFAEQAWALWRKYFN